MTDAEILDRFPNLSALVIGDICLDRWCRYDPAMAEASRETGIPRIAVTATEVTPGAGGTVANNLIALGAGRVAVLGAIGADGFAFELTQGLKQRGISANLLIEVPAMQTFTYTKLINMESGAEDRPRVDFITNAPLHPDVERRILERILTVFEDFDIILISDQAETHLGGIVTPGVRALLADLAPNYPEKVFVADSRTRIDLFRNILLKPNQHEAGIACRKLFGRIDYPALREHVSAKVLMVTHGAEGVLVVDADGEKWVRTKPVEHPVDICGAGDSFSAGMSLALAATGSPARAAEFGNRVASITIMKPGTGTASPREILESVSCK
ncbi:MAG: PfkB family carbohydrate kinase [Acidobacteriota bacterium]|nr:PfkB family carbohydrate kinase [Acidobacteriota bacterium]